MRSPLAERNGKMACNAPQKRDLPNGHSHADRKCYYGREGIEQLPRAAGGKTNVRGVMYHSKKRSPIPCVSKTVESGTLSRICGRIAPDIRIKRGGSPADKRFP